MRRLVNDNNQKSMHLSLVLNNEQSNLIVLYVLTAFEACDMVFISTGITFFSGVYGFIALWAFYAFNGYVRHLERIKAGNGIEIHTL